MSHKHHLHNHISACPLHRLRRVRRIGMALRLRHLLRILRHIEVRFHRTPSTERRLRRGLLSLFNVAYFDLRVPWKRSLGVYKTSNDHNEQVLKTQEVFGVRTALKTLINMFSRISIEEASKCWSNDDCKTTQRLIEYQRSQSTHPNLHKSTTL
jgi:hypothetical protein